MKLKFTSAEIERSSSFESTQFDIGDKRIIMEILRGKMYSNPIQTICQEIACNARDAHKEVGKADLPIEIKIPNKLEPFFYIKDFGPGISPDRVSNVYVLYGVSTKRHANEEDGGFGLGSKSPFSYTDTFTVICVTTENDKRIRREYLAHIDESGLGQMSLVKEEETQEPQGTTVQFYVEEKDFASFGTHVKRACTHWKVHPTIKGDPEWKWPEIKEDYSGKGWAVHSVSPLDSRIHALINDIPYNFNLRHVFSNDIPEMYKHLETIPFRLHFSIGEIPVTANREEIDYQAHVISSLREKVEETVRDFQGILIKKLADCKNLREAVIFWQGLRKTTYGGLLAATKWREFKLADYENIRVTQISGIRLVTYVPCNNSYGHKKRGNSRAIPIAEGTLLVEDDIKTKGIARARLATLFQREAARQVILVDFLKKEVEVKGEDGVTHIELDYADDETVKNRKKDINWDLLDPIKLSTVPKRKVEPTNRVRKKAIKLKVFSRATRLWSPLPQESELPLVKFYVETASKSIILHQSNGVTLTHPLGDVSNTLAQLDTIINIGKDPSDKITTQLFGVVPSEAAKLDKTWYPFYTYATQVLESFKKQIPSTVEDWDQVASRLFGRSFYQVISAEKFLKGITPASPFHEYLLKSEEAEEALKLVSLYNGLSQKFRIGTIRTAQNSTGGLRQMYNDILKRYPLLACLQNFYGGYANAIDDIIDYVNLKDKKFAESQTKEKSNEKV